MSILNIFRSSKKFPSSANIAKDRLMQLIVDERIQNLDGLQKELIRVISRHLAIDERDISVEVERDDNRKVLEINVVLPEDA